MYVHATVLTLKNALKINRELVFSLIRIPLGPSAARRWRAIKRSGSVSIFVVAMSLGNSQSIALCGKLTTGQTREAPSKATKILDLHAKDDGQHAFDHCRGFSTTRFSETAA
jgi:hypothetical protein